MHLCILLDILEDVGLSMKYQTILSFQKHLDSKEAFARVYLIAIPDDFERKKWIGRLLKLLCTSNQSPFFLSAADSTLAELFTAIDSPSLFEPEPFAVIDEVEKLSKKEAQKFLELLSQEELQGHLIFGSRGKSPLFGVVEKNGVLLDLSDEKPWEKEKRLGQQILEKVSLAGKRFSSGAQQALLERVDKDLALLEKEVDKLICYVGGKTSIEVADVFQIIASSRTQTLWQMAEEIVWEAKFVDSIDEGMFHGLMPSIRSQLQLGLKIASLVEANRSSAEIQARVPKVWPKMLEKRIFQASQLQSEYFKRGLQMLFQIELLSRSGSSDLSALLDFFRASMRK